MRWIANVKKKIKSRNYSLDLSEQSSEILEQKLWHVKILFCLQKEIDSGAKISPQLQSLKNIERITAQTREATSSHLRAKLRSAEPCANRTLWEQETLGDTPRRSRLQCPSPHPTAHTPESITPCFKSHWKAALPHTWVFQGGQGDAQGEKASVAPSCSGEELGPAAERLGCPVQGQELDLEGPCDLVGGMQPSGRVWPLGLSLTQ